MKQISIWLASKAGNNNQETINQNNYLFKSQQQHRDHANETTRMVYIDDTGQIIM